MAYVTRRPVGYPEKKKAMADRYEIRTPDGERLRLPFGLKTKASLLKARKWIYGRHGMTDKPNVPWEELQIVDLMAEDVEDIRKRAGISTNWSRDTVSRNLKQIEDLLVNVADELYGIENESQRKEMINILGEASQKLRSIRRRLHTIQ